MTILSPKALLVSTLLLLSPIATLAATPSTAPKVGDMAVSFNAGFDFALDDDFEGGELVFTGTFEYYTTPRVSWRGLLGTTSFEGDFPGNPSLDFTFFNANYVYNWERGKFHPFLTGGIGLYQKDGSSSLPSEFDESVFGLNGGGGVDWFLGPRWGLKFEGTLHVLTGENPNTILLGTGGVMFWF